MRDPSPTAGERSAGTESYLRLMLNLVSLVAGVVVIAVVMATGRTHGKPARPRLAPPPALAAVPARPEVTESPEEPRAPAPAPAPAPAVKPLDRAAVGRAEAALDEASRDRARAEARLAEAQRLLAASTIEAQAAAA